MFLERGLAIEDGGGGEVAVATEKGAGAIEIGFPRPREGETPSDGGTDVRGWEGGGPPHQPPPALWREAENNRHRAQIYRWRTSMKRRRNDLWRFKTMP